MAEVFGVISGAIGVGSLAIQVFDSVQKLKAFCGAVENAPRDVVNILQELEMLAGMLLSLRKDLDQNAVADLNEPAAHQSLEYCVKVSQELELILADLEREMMRNGRKRKWAMVKIVTSGDRIKDHLIRLERAKSMLSLSIGCLSLKLQLKLRSSQDMVGSANTRPLKQSSKLHHMQQKPYLYFSSSSWKGLGSYSYKSASHASKRRRVECPPNDKHHIERTFLSSMFFFRKGFTLTSARSHGNWQYTFTPFRIIPDADPIWDTCASGDIELLKEYFEDGYTVFDTSCEGYTLLHTAAANARPQLCQWLLEQGAKTSVTVGNLGGTPLYYTIICCSTDSGVSRFSTGPLRVTGSTKSRAVNVIDSLRVLVEHGNCDPMVGNRFHLSPISVYNGPVEGYRYLLDYQQVFMIDIEASDDGGSRVIDSKLIANCSAGFEIARFTLAKLKPEEHVNRSLEHGANFGRVKSNIPTGFTLLHAALYRLMDIYQIEAPLSEGFLFLEDLLKMGFDIHAITRNGTTPLDFLLGFNYHDLDLWINSGNGVQRLEADGPLEVREARELERDKSSLLQSWMQVLRSHGVSLHSYWKEAEITHPGGLLGNCSYLRVGINRVFSVEYGDEDEVIVSVRDVAEETDGVNLPGAWIEDDVYMDGDGFIVMHGLKAKANWIVDSRSLKKEKALNLH